MKNRRESSDKSHVYAGDGRDKTKELTEATMKNQNGRSKRIWRARADMNNLRVWKAEYIRKLDYCLFSFLEI